MEYYTVCYNIWKYWLTEAPGKVSGCGRVGGAMGPWKLINIFSFWAELGVRVLEKRERERERESKKEERKEEENTFTFYIKDHL